MHAVPGRIAVTIASILVGVLVVSACSSSTTSGGSTGGTNASGPGTSGATAANTANTSCIPAFPSKLPPSDTDLTKLPATAQKALGGYPDTVNASPWSSYKPSHAPPYKIGVAMNEANQATADVYKGIKSVLAKTPNMFSAPIETVANPANDANSQIQGMRTLLSQGVDMILAPLASPTALNSVIDQAAAKNVPVISILGTSTDKYAVNVQPNSYQVGYQAAAQLVRNMGKAKDVLMVHGLTGVSIDADIYNAGSAVLKACGKNLLGPITGNYDPGTAKTQTLEFLATHPGDIGGVFEVSSMALGIIQAFEQSGRSVPPVTDNCACQPSMAYWRDHVKTYKGLGVGLPTGGTGAYAMDIGVAMLQGRGVKINNLPYTPINITTANLNQWVSPSATTSSTNSASDGPEGAIPAPSLIDAYFTRTAN